MSAGNQAVGKRISGVLASLRQWILPLAALTLIFAPPSVAQATGKVHAQSLAGLSLEQLGNVEVTTASKEPEELWQTPAAVYVLTQQDIRRSGATSIPEALRLVPGVEVARIDSGHWAVGIRGFGSTFSKSVLVLIDGRSVYTPLFAGVYWDVQNVLLDDVERIEVIRGPGGTIWGANAVNGVINIITKSATQTHGALVSAGGGSVDQGTGAARYGGTLGRNLNYRFYGLGFTRGPEFHSDQRNFDDWRAGQAGFRTDWTSRGSNDFTAEGDMYRGEVGGGTSVGIYQPPSQMVLEANAEVAGGNVMGNWRHRFGDNSDFRFQGYYDRTSRLTPQLGEKRDTFDLDFLYHLGLGARQDLLLGAGARWSPDAITQTIPTLDIAPHQETDKIYSWFGQDKIALVADKLWLTLGSKFEHNNYTGFEAQPDARLLFTPVPHQAFWIAATRAVRTPSRLDRDLLLTDFLGAPPPTYLRVVGSSDFDSEHLVGTEIGYRGVIGRNFFLDITGFRNSYDDLYGYGTASVFLEPSPAPAHLVFQLPLANALEGDTEGVEVAPNWKVSNWWELRGSYSFLHLVVSDQRGFTDALNTASDNGSSPHHEAGLQSLFDLPRKIELDLTYRYVSALPAQAVRAYQTGDVRLGWKPAPRLELSIVGRNLLQPEHEEFGGDPGPLVGIKRSVYAQITWTEPEQQP
ncbi:MAG TPA: TonB-dependent receptor plug domain-containing protein [Candidatus Acidoferrales bacterium]|nr:TonB-dependent receptor plug domain-containing protein [Candidatus Acidoferrales bacterium]